MLHNEGILIENIKKKGNNVLIWGACERNNDILDFFKQNDVNVVGYIDQNSDKQNTYNDLPVYNKDIIRSDNYFVYVGLLKNYDEVISHLGSNNYREFDDYWYPNREIKLDGSCSYSDLYGNEYVGEKYNINIILKNCGKLYIGEKCEFNDIQLLVCDMSEIQIGDEVKFRGKSSVRCTSQSKIYLGKKYCSECYIEICAHNNSNININDNVRIVASIKETEFVNIAAIIASSIIIGENTAANGNLNIMSVQNSKIIMGKDCMLSRDIIIRAGNSHNIFDLETGENLTSIGRSIVIGDHVWIGHRATLFSGCEIGSGSIIGINTFVNKKFPANCSIAGNPAKIIKENVAWRRESYPYFDSYDDFADFDFR